MFKKNMGFSREGNKQVRYIFNGGVREIIQWERNFPHMWSTEFSPQQFGDLMS